MSNDANTLNMDTAALEAIKPASLDPVETRDLNLSPATATASQALPAQPNAQVLMLKNLIKTLIKVSFPPLVGIALFLLGWTCLSHYRPTLPSPWVTAQSAAELFAHPFYIESENDQGIGWNILSSLGRVGTGFGLAALVGIPLGFIIGRVKFVHGMFAPIISILRPVSPLAWLPIGMVVFQAANPASVWVIFISSIWPIILNTSAGVSQIPQDYLNIARVLQLSEWKVFTKILLPASLPYLLTGIRLSVGVAWLVIVAAEMVSGGKGIGFWVWDEYQNSQYAHIIVGIFVVGILGLVIEQLLIQITKLFSHGEATS